MGALLNFERFVQGLVEGSVFRLLRSRIEPVEIAKRLGHAMESEQTVGVGRIIVPNRYTVRLNPDDFAGLEAIVASIQDELVVYLSDLAYERGLSFVGSPAVALEADSAVAPKDIRIVTAITDTGGQPMAPPTREIAERTQFFRPISGPLRDRGPSLVRIDPAGAGWRHRLDEVTRIGRGFDNEMIIEERTVSRNHAEIRREGGAYRIVDLDSTNGILVNGIRVRDHVLRPGDRVRLGSVEFAFDPASD